MRIKQTDDIQLSDQIHKKLKENDGYCPCKLEKIPQNFCMCRQFVEGPKGPCHCGLYIKIQE